MIIRAGAYRFREILSLKETRKLKFRPCTNLVDSPGFIDQKYLKRSELSGRSVRIDPYRVLKGPGMIIRAGAYRFREILSLKETRKLKFRPCTNLVDSPGFIDQKYLKRSELSGRSVRIDSYRV